MVMHNSLVLSRLRSINIGNVYVADNENDRIQKFDVGHFIATWGSQGGYNGQFRRPT